MTRPASLSQAEIARAIKAAEACGKVAVMVRLDGGPSPDFSASEHPHLGAEPWVPESDLDDLRELVRKAYHAMNPNRPDGPLSRRLAQITRKKLEDEVRKHFPGEVDVIEKDTDL